MGRMKNENESVAKEGPWFDVDIIYIGFIGCMSIYILLIVISLFT